MGKIDNASAWSLMIDHLTATHLRQPFATITDIFTTCLSNTTKKKDGKVATLCHSGRTKQFGFGTKYAYIVTFSTSKQHSHLSSPPQFEYAGKRLFPLNLKNSPRSQISDLEYGDRWLAVATVNIACIFGHPGQQAILAWLTAIGRILGAN